MAKRCRLVLLLFCLYLTFSESYAQDSLSIQLPENYITKTSQRIDDLKGKIDRESEKFFRRFQDREDKLRRKLFRKDSSLCKEIFSGDFYQSFQEKLNYKNVTGGYIAYLDT